MSSTMTSVEERGVHLSAPQLMHDHSPTVGVRIPWSQARRLRIALNGGVDGDKAFR